MSHAPAQSPHRQLTAAAGRGCLLAMILLGPGHVDGHAQSGLDPGCAAPEHRQFDFWEGAWTVTDSTGAVLGTNDITRIAGGCGLQEHWRGVRGGEGMSLNVWQPALERWTQFWVGTGAVLLLTGGVNHDGRMVLQGEREMPEGMVLDRITWTSLPEGEVRQQWETSTDSGLSWQRGFTGIYRRRDDPPDAGPDGRSPAATRLPPVSLAELPCTKDRLRTQPEA